MDGVYILTIKTAKNKLTGRADGEPTIVLGHRVDGSPGMTVHMPFSYSYAGFSDPEVLMKFIKELTEGYVHLTGGPYHQDGGI